MVLLPSNLLTFGRTKMKLETAIRRAESGKSTKIYRSTRGMLVNSPRLPADERIAWEVRAREDGAVSLHHWGTHLVTAQLDSGGYWQVVELNPRLGWGSVSDQTGYNEFFSVLGIPYRMDRDKRGGGPRIVECRRPAYPRIP